MSLTDLEIRQHTKPILAELGRQKEKTAKIRRERDDLRAALVAERMRNATALYALLEAVDTYSDCSCDDDMTASGHSKGCYWYASVEDALAVAEEALR